MAGVPRGIDPTAVLAQLHAIPKVVEVHDLHVWTLVGSKRNMWAHIVVEPGTDSTPIILAAQRVARAHNCMHTCFQVEDAGAHPETTLRLFSHAPERPGMTSLLNRRPPASALLHCHGLLARLG